jgi:hypothetical protein
VNAPSPHIARTGRSGRASAHPTAAPSEKPIIVCSPLRGFGLRKRGESGAIQNSPGYDALDNNDKKLQYHPSLHTQPYYNWVAGNLALAYTGSVCSDASATTELFDMDQVLDVGKAPY